MAIASRMNKLDRQYETIDRDLAQDGIQINEIADQLDELAQRLQRVQALGGQYAQVDFSPYIKAMMA